jgi:hypothetical protein
MSDIINIRFEQYKPPTFKEAKSGSIILYGDKPGNPYPDYLINLYEQSTNHKAVVDAKVRYTTGGGWTVDTLRMPLAEEAVYIDKLKHINEAGESLDDLTEKISLDYQIFNSFAIEVIYNKAKTKWAALNYVPISRIRAYKTDSGDIKYVHLTDWRNVSKYEQAKTFGETRGFKEWYAFGSRKNPSDSELLYFRGFRPIKSGEVDVYAVPFYSGAIPWIELDIRTGIFHLNNIRNNFTAGAVLNFFNGDPTPEQKEEMERQIKAKFTGDNAEDTGGIMLVFNKPGTTGVTVERLQAGDMDKLYLQVAEFARQGIMTAHNINPILAGINTPGALGQRNEAEFMFEMFNSTYIQPIQEMVFERVINDLMQFNGLKPMFKLKDVKPFGMVFTEAFIEANLPADIKTKLAADYVGVDINVERQKLAFSSDVDPFDELEGEDPNNYEILASFDIEYDENGYPVKNDLQFKSMHFAKVVEAKLSGLDADIMAAIQDNPKITPAELASALKKDLNEITDRLDTLKELKIVVGEPGDLKVSKLGENTIKDQDLEVDIRVMYQYELSPTAPPLVKGGKSRDWCIKRMNNPQLFSREQIDSIAKSPNAPGNGSPWLYRGGFYNNPKLGEITPFCRHIWVAKVVRKK